MTPPSQPSPVKGEGIGGPGANAASREPPVLFTVADGIATVTLNRPKARNAYNLAAIQALGRIWQEVREAPAIRVVIITGAGNRDFCTGLDTQMSPEEMEQFRHWVRDDPSGLGFRAEAWLKHVDMWKPIIAAVNGNCVATGMGVLTAADIRISAEHASFATPEARLGLIAQSGAVTRLPRQIPYCHAMMLLLTGQRIPAEEALRLGLINEVVPAARLMDRALEIARGLRERDPHALQITKQAVLRGLDVGQRAALVQESLYREMLEARRRG